MNRRDQFIDIFGLDTVVAWDIRTITGHDPQKLLPHHKPNYDLWDPWTLASIIADLPTSENVFESFFPKAGKPQRYYIEGGHFDMFAPGVIDPEDETIYFDHPPCRRIAPWIEPRQQGKTARLENVRLSYPHLREERWQHKLAVVPVVIDYGTAEARAIMHVLSNDRSIRAIMLDLKEPSGDIAGNPQLSLYAQGLALAKEQYVEKVAKKAPPSYMKHDPTKQHGRRKRK